MAVAADVGRKYTEAIALYEECLQNNSLSRAGLVNLLLIYFQFSEPGFAANHDLDKGLIHSSVENLKRVLARAIYLNPDDQEVRFWEKYIPARLTYDNLEEEVVLEILATCKERSLVPYFYLYLLHPEKYQSERNMLRENSQATSTTRNRYILSLLEPMPWH